MDTGEATNPLDAADTSIEDTGTDETGVEESETHTLYDGDGNPIEETGSSDEGGEDQGGDDEEEEIDLDDDLKLRVPKTAAQKLRELKEGSLRQADYTKKTQDLAEQRKAFETTRQAFAETTAEELGVMTQFTALQQQVAQFEQIDWDKWEADDPFEAQKGFRQYQMALRQQQQAGAHLQHMRNERLSKAQQETARRIEEGRAILAKEIPGGWTDDLRAKLLDYAAGYGFSRDDLDDLEADPRVARVLHAAFEGQQAKAAATKLANLANGKRAQPAKVVKGTSGAAPVTADTSDFAAFERMALKKMA